MPDKVEQITEYLLELDALKQVQRRTYVGSQAEDTQRRENSAEHSWHLAMACWNIANCFELDLNHEKLLKLALVHDLGEIDAGDTFLYADNRHNAHEEERQCIQRLASHPGNGIADLPALWEEQEQGSSREARFLKVVDRLLPFLHNIASQGKTWRELGVKKSQVAVAHAFIASEFPEIHSWLKANLQYATEQGWLLDA